MLTTSQAAAELGITTGRMRVLIRSGRVQATRTFDGYQIERAALKAIAVRTNGRPRKHTDNCGRTGRVGMVTNCKMDCGCWCHRPRKTKGAAQ